MNLHPLSPSYPFDPFSDPYRLAGMLKADIDVLGKIAANPRRYYRPIKVERNGKLRHTWDAKRPLKGIQARIQCLFLKKAHYPLYLRGGIADPADPRHALSNAAVHRGAAVVLKEDICEFFPSVSDALVYGVWNGMFKFPPQIAALLTSLTTLEGHLPQGVKTSPYLANLVLWRHEPRLVNSLHLLGLKYTRYVDDITISSRRSLSGKDLDRVARLVVGALSPCGLRLKRKKHEVGRDNESLRVTGYVINRRVAVPREARGQARSAVRACERTVDKTSNDYLRTWHHASGKVSRIAALHSDGLRLRDRLNVIKPH